MESLSEIIATTLEEVKKVDSVCDIHGEKMIQFKDHKPFCRRCTLAKMHTNEQSRIARAVKSDSLRQTSKVLALDSLVPDKTILQADFVNYDTSNSETVNAKEKAESIARRYSDVSNNFNTVLTGIAGTGKSHLAMSILKKVNDNTQTSCLFISTNELMRKIRESFNNRQTQYTEAYWVGLLKRVDLLVLDDFGSESTFRNEEQQESSEYTQNVLFGILEARTRTIITTNLTSEELRKIYNPKIISRMYRGLSQNEVIKFTTETTDKRVNFEF